MVRITVAFSTLSSVFDGVLVVDLGVFIVSNAITCSVAVWNFFIAAAIDHNRKSIETLEVVADLADSTPPTVQIDAFIIAVAALSLVFILFMYAIDDVVFSPPVVLAYTFFIAQNSMWADTEELCCCPCVVRVCVGWSVFFNAILYVYGW